MIKKINILPFASNKSDAIHESSPKVIRSPKDAAIGVATLSGLIRHFLDSRMTPTIIIPEI